MLNFERKTNSSFLIYAHFESILVPEDNEQQSMLLVVMVINVGSVIMVLLIVMSK